VSLVRVSAAAEPSRGNTEERRRYITPTRLARDINQIFEVEITPKTLQRWRARKKGPAFFKIGRSIRYYVRDVERWVEAQRHNGTSVLAEATHAEK